MTPDVAKTRAWRAGLIIFAGLVALYLATLAPRVTFWDAGEFIAAIDSWGIPHPPGTPLYVTLGRAVHVVASGVPTALVVNALSAVLTATACALGGALLVRRGAPLIAGIAAGVCAGCATSVWLSATEAEVYSASLLLSALMLMTADHAAEAQRAGDDRRAAKHRSMLVYLFALAAPLHASALVGGPAAVWLCIDGGRGDYSRWRDQLWWRLELGAALVAAGGLATGRFLLAAVAAAVLAATAIIEAASARANDPRAGDPRIGGQRPAGARWAAALPVVALVAGATPLLIMLMRAGFDPAINQGNPSTLHALGDEIARRQYDVASLWPRQAPPWIQLANFFQYADWQFALGLAPETTPSAVRVVVSLLFAALGVIGARAHRARDARSFRALLVLLLSGSLGVIAYLNLKAGPSIGWGILPDATPHEARERDYFFTLAFWTWGLWAGYGAYALAARRLHARRAWVIAAAALAIAALPALTNWRAMNRRREPDASAASTVADALLASAPPNGVLVVWGDNDSYPLWEAQRSRAVRRDVTVVTSPLLGATWYRDELRRRWRIDTGPLANEDLMVARAVASARAIGRPVAIAVTVPAELRVRVGGSWSLCGLVWTGSSRCEFAGGESIARYLRAHPPGRFTDNTVRGMLGALRCPVLVQRATLDSAGADSLAAACNTR
ncbi:MAG: protein O-mannosyl-transferase family [Gemmatimonadaceae bacterium]